MSERRLVLGIVIVLAILHHDVWFWSDPSLVLGFLPVGLAWHAGFSLTAAAVWLLVTRYAWPGDPVEEQA